MKKPSLYDGKLPSLNYSNAVSNSGESNRLYTPGYSISIFDNYC